MYFPPQIIPQSQTCAAVDNELPFALEAEVDDVSIVQGVYVRLDPTRAGYAEGRTQSPGRCGN